MSGNKCLKIHMALNDFDIKSLEVKHPASNVWATNILGVKHLESVITSAKFATQVQGYTCVNGVPLGGLPSSGFWDQTRNILLTVLDIDDKAIK